MLKRFLVVLTVFSLVLGTYFYSQTKVQAAALTSMSDTMTRLQTSTLSSHDILFTLVGANTVANGDTITIDFDEDGGKFTVANSGWVVGDFDFNDGAERVIFGVVQGTAPQTPDCTGSVGVNDIAVAVETDTGKIKFAPCSSYTASGAAPIVNIEFGSVAAGPGTNRITNPGSSGSTVIAITETTDSGSLAVPIMTSDQVTVSGTVDPSITSTLSSSACTLTPTPLTTTAISVCSYTNGVDTNATGGYTSTITEDGELRTAAADTITEVSDGNVETTVDDEEYGVASSDAGAQTITDWDGTCDGDAGGEPATAIDGTAQSYADSGGPATETTTLCHAAGIAAVTEAGVYQHVVTHITTGIF